ncbi:unnamed protein product [Kluyveromyces dobzhanskii CBS 2104]|uniref:WGS project CCBQ000000000 data, contig 00172 n=1 Tax=Kluyveromyces dobzhanskii CBS 2104 TaxID=1427455 RepID=A0A0A8L0V1_9SACH|nr:unnamed protein product [Kluyveromyces dobzhanskii CBS 2104]
MPVTTVAETLERGPPAKKQKLSAVPNKKLIINAFLMGSAGNQTINSWRQEDDRSSELFQNPSYWTDLAKLLEKGKFNAVFFADVLGPYDVYKGPGNFGPVAKAGSQWPISDPSYFIPLMASVTKNLAFGITISTISEQPYHLSRRLGTLDLLSNGRVGWNIVTSYLDSASRNLLGGETLPQNNERYERAEEFVDVVYKLFLSSWRDGAVKKDKKTGVFTDPEGLRHINHEGKYFKVPGPSITYPSQQKLPVIIQAGASPKGRELAARTAEVIFLSNKTKESLREAIQGVKVIAREQFNRDLSKIKFLSLINVIIGDTREEALEKYQSIKTLADDDAAAAMFSGWTGVDLDQYEDDQVLEDVEHRSIASAVKKWKEAYPGVKRWTKKTIIDELKVAGSGPIFVGTAEEVADTIQEWVAYSDVDGFNFAYTSIPTSYERIINELLPKLRERGLLQEDYPEPKYSDKLTFREQLFGDSYLDITHPAHDLRWQESETKAEFKCRLPAALKKLKGLK